jgi:acetamidase/formamidase/AraC-like DNA-binding protein
MTIASPERVPREHEHLASPMSVCSFTSESYCEHDRPAAWQDVLAELGLRTASQSAFYGGHAIAARRSSPDGVAVARLTAAAQILSPLSQRADIPLVLLASDDAVLTRDCGTRQSVAAGKIAVLPRQSAWQLSFARELRAIVLSVTTNALHGRKTGTLAFGSPHILEASGLAGVLSSALEATADALESLSATEWATVRQSLAEMHLTLVREISAGGTDWRGTASKAALLDRIGQTIERELYDPDLTPAGVAQMQGISERYLQRLFEDSGDNFTRYLRERRLQRSWEELSNVAAAHHSVSDIAYQCGFRDAAHFSRAFRDRFGQSPRAFRQQERKRVTALTVTHHQRGWPKEALVQCQRAPEPRTSLVRDANDTASAAENAEHRHHHLSVDATRVHWGYFSHSRAPAVEIASGDTITIETLTQHASDDPERMIDGDAGAESVFRWTREKKNVDRRGAGPMDASIFGRGAGEGFGVHICTGPIAIKDAQPGDVLEVRILDIVPRPSRSPAFAGRVFGSSVAAWWGYHYAEFLTDPKPREAVTIYEIVATGDDPHARAVYSYRWQPQIDPFGVVHNTYDYPGVLVAPGTVKRRHGVLDGIRIPLRPHFGVVGVAPQEADPVDSIPPAYFGGNLDNWRLGKGAAVYLPVSVPGALLSVGDPHAAQGDGELSGTAIECSMTGTFRVILHKKSDLAGQPFSDLTYPLIETETDWVLTGFSHPNYLAEFGASGQSEVYAKSSLDLAMKDAFRKARRFLMNTRGLSEDEAIALISATVDFGVTQVVDGNWGVHAVLSKRLFATDSVD